MILLCFVLWVAKWFLFLFSLLLQALADIIGFFGEKSEDYS